MDAAKNHQMARVLPAFIETRAQAKAARYPLCFEISGRAGGRTKLSPGRRIGIRFNLFKE